jgi:hypothetical protein
MFVAVRRADGISRKGVASMNEMSNLMEQNINLFSYSDEEIGKQMNKHRIEDQEPVEPRKDIWDKRALPLVDDMEMPGIGNNLQSQTENNLRQDEPMENQLG